MAKSLMTHIYFGDQNKDFSIRLAQVLLDSGADILEVGIPYTDPVCDGEIFQRACKRAIENEITPFDVIDGIKILRQKGYKQPIYLTSYYGPIFKIGIKLFVTKAKEVGVQGLIIPDLLLEEQDDLSFVCKQNSLSIIQFATVYSSKERLKKICKASTDFMYCISLPGVTGDETGETKRLASLLNLLKEMTTKKIYVGFGIKSQKDAKDLLKLGADGVIVGSAIANIYESYLKNPFKSLEEVSFFVKRIKESTIK